MAQMPERAKIRCGRARAASRCSWRQRRHTVVPYPRSWVQLVVEMDGADGTAKLLVGTLLLDEQRGQDGTFDRPAARLPDLSAPDGPTVSDSEHSPHQMCDVLLHPLPRPPLPELREQELVGVRDVVGEVLLEGTGHPGVEHHEHRLFIERERTIVRVH